MIFKNLYERLGNWVAYWTPIKLPPESYEAVFSPLAASPPRPHAAVAPQEKAPVVENEPQCEVEPDIYEPEDWQIDLVFNNGRKSTLFENLSKSLAREIWAEFNVCMSNRTAFVKCTPDFSFVLKTEDIRSVYAGPLRTK